MSPEPPPPERKEIFLLLPPAATPPPLAFPDMRGARHLVNRTPICQIEGFDNGVVAVAFDDSPARLDMTLSLVGIRSLSPLAEPRKVLERAQQQAWFLLLRVSIDDLASERCSTCRPAPAVIDLVRHVILVGCGDDCFWTNSACLPTHVLPPSDAWRGRQPTRRQASMVVDASENWRRGEKWPTGLVSPSLQQELGKFRECRNGYSSFLT